MITIRDLKEEDISIILKPVHKMFVEHDLREPRLFTPNSFTEEAIIDYYKKTFENENSQVFIAEYDGEVAGTIKSDIKDTPGFYKERKTGYMDDLVVLENFRGRGVAKALIKKAEEWFKSKGINLVESKIYEWNKASSQLSEKVGYRKIFSYYYKSI